jgi:hypothetical protein
MKKYILVLASLAALIAATPARADKPVFTKVQYTDTITCDDETAANDDSRKATVRCEPEDLKKYPFLADLTKEPTEKGSVYQFDIARVEDKALAKPIFLLKMHNETIYTWPWGSAGAFAINADGTYIPQWTITGGTVAYTSSCPNKFSYIVKGNEKNTYAEWDYDGKNIARVAGYDKLEDFPSCK